MGGSAIRFVGNDWGEGVINWKGLYILPKLEFPTPYYILSHILAELFNMYKGILFFRLLEGLVYSSCIQECWGKVYGYKLLPC